MRVAQRTHDRMSEKGKRTVLIGKAAALPAAYLFPIEPEWLPDPKQTTYQGSVLPRIRLENHG